LSGFERPPESRVRQAIWEPDDSYDEIDEAERAAKEWVASQSRRAEVEVIDFKGKVGEVVRVVTPNGTETVTSGPPRN
jgi:endonuclease YncB( thermonuclease family)